MGERTQDALRPYFGRELSSANLAEFDMAYIRHLDEAGPEEKASFEWAHARATGQECYEQEMMDLGLVGENVETGNPVVDLIRQAGRERTDPNKRLVSMPSWLKAVDLWHHLNDDPGKLISWKLLSGRGKPRPYHIFTR